MSGKVYTMKEMKNIVAYLTEHKAYGEIRGRKMWVDFANSNTTTRSWQSLKETFLKRILPDIHNPYYNLTREQVISFRQGYDVHERDKNKLEIEVVAEIHKDSDQHVISSDGEAMVQGENDKCSNIISKDISEKNNCYETVDDVRRDLESPNADEDKIQKHSNFRKIPPALENVLKDFASDSEDCPKIIEDISAVEVQENTEFVPLQNSDTEKKEPDSVDDVQYVETDAVEIKSEKENSMEEPSQSNNTDNDIDKQLSEKVLTIETGNEKVNEKDTSHDILEISSTNDKNTETVSNKKNETSEILITPTTNSCQPLTNSTSDTILPNNQEGLKDQTAINTKADDEVESKKSSTNHTRKRSSSAETVLLENKRHKRNSTSNRSKTNCNPEENASDPEILDVHDSDSAKEIATSTQIDKTKNINAIQNDDEEPQTQNPCLKSVSLFAEQFNKTKYLDTTSDENAVKEIDPKPSGSKERKKSRKEEVKDDVVVLKSHSESESDEEPQEKRPAVSKRITRAQRDKAMANVFGFNSGAVSSNRNRKASQNRVRRPHNVHHINNVTDSESSEWTTDTEQDNFISPPRCRQNRKTRKYLKPKSTRILSLEEEGGLFVMYGKRIYPVVKDGRIVKNYLIYESNSDSGFEQDSYWKAKYAELKKKYEENKKTKEPYERLREKRSSATREPSSPILQSNTRKNPTPAQNRDIHAPSTSNTKRIIDNKELVNFPVENKMSTDKIMIKYTINNAEVQLEGHWPQICPIFDKVLDVLPRKTDPQMEVARHRLEAHEQPKVISSRDSTPVIMTGDYAVQEKIDKLESEIFKEIEEKDKQEQMEKTEDVQMERNKDEQMEENKQENPNNVTTRKRGRPTKPSMPQESPKSSKKQLRANKVEQELSIPTSDTVEKQTNISIPAQNSPQVVKRRTRRSMKMALDAHNVDEKKTNKVTPKQSDVTQETETQEDDVRYMFPSTTTQTNTNKQKPRRY